GGGARRLRVAGDPVRPDAGARGRRPRVHGDRGRLHTYLRHHGSRHRILLGLQPARPDRLGEEHGPRADAGARPEPALSERAGGGTRHARRPPASGRLRPASRSSGQERSVGRRATWWEVVRDSLWFLPAVFTAAAGGLAFTTIRIDRTLLADAQLQAPYLLGVGAEGARGILDAVSSSIITVTGVVFSITIVALQLASNQFTPRLLRNFTADRANQVVLGIFIGTFTYALLVEGTIRSGPEREFVPTISVAI